MPLRQESNGCELQYLMDILANFICAYNIGMMTGQMFAGADPVQASYYQMAILFLIGTTTSLGSISTVLMAVFRAVDSNHRLRADRLHLRNRAAGIEVWAFAQAAKVCSPKCSSTRFLLNSIQFTAVCSPAGLPLADFLHRYRTSNSILFNFPCRR